MCGVGVSMGMQMLGNYSSRRAQQRQLAQQYSNMATQYTQQAQNARNMATVNRNNAGIVRFNEGERGRQGAQEQKYIRQRGEQALAGINVASAANGVQGMSIDNIYSQSAKATAEDLNTSKYNTNLDMYGQEIQASNYENQAGAYDQMAGYYDDMSGYFNRLASNVSSTPAWQTFLSGIPSALQTYFNWQNITQGSGAGDVRAVVDVSKQDSRYANYNNVDDVITTYGDLSSGNSSFTNNYSTYGQQQNALNWYSGTDNRNHTSYQTMNPLTSYYGNIGDRSFWTTSSQTINTINSLNGRSLPLGITID